MTTVDGQQEDSDLEPGLSHLRAADPVLARLIDGGAARDPYAWRSRRPTLDLFGGLVFAVTGQQISVAAAMAIFSRLLEHFDGRMPHPLELATIDPTALRGLGFSRQKANTLREIAQRFQDGRLSDVAMRNLSDQDAIAHLTEIKGVGDWTAKGALLLAYRRADLVRDGDIALRHAVEIHYGLDHLPLPEEVAEMAERWRPYRSLASSLLLAASS